MSELSYQLPFDQAVDQINQRINSWLAGPKFKPPELEDFEDPICLKNSELVVIHANQPYYSFFAGGTIPIGKKATTFLHNGVANISVKTDGLIKEGVSCLQFEHIGRGPDGRLYNICAYKRPLPKSNETACVVLEVSRPLSIREAETGGQLSVEEQFGIYSNFSVDDKLICASYARGDSTKEIAAALDLSTKAIENHRKKMMLELRVERPVEIVKLLVRFEERGFLEH